MVKDMGMYVVSRCILFLASDFYTAAHPLIPQLICSYQLNAEFHSLNNRHTDRKTEDRTDRLRNRHKEKDRQRHLERGRQIDSQTTEEQTQRTAKEQPRRKTGR